MAVQWIEDAPIFDFSDWHFQGVAYDVYGNFDWIQTIWDNGLVSTLDVDQLQEANWDSYISNYDPFTGITTGLIVYDDGSYLYV
jgi:hypothetical protein